MCRRPKGYCLNFKTAPLNGSDRKFVRDCLLSMYAFKQSNQKKRKQLTLFTAPQALNGAFEALKTASLSHNHRHQKFTILKQLSLSSLGSKSRGFNMHIYDLSPVRTRTPSELGESRLWAVKTKQKKKPRRHCTFPYKFPHQSPEFPPQLGAAAAASSATS